jgi:hypothetical protein
MPQGLSEYMSKSATDRLSERMPDRMSDYMSDRYIVSWWDDAKKVIIVPVSLLFLVVGTISSRAHAAAGRN